MKVMRKMISLLAVILVSVFPALFLFFQNVNEMYLGEIIKPIAIFLLIACLIVIVLCLFTKHFEISCAISAALMLFLLNFKYVQNLIQIVIPSARYWQILPVGIVIILIVGFSVCRKYKDTFMDSFLIILAITFGVLIILNFVVALPSLFLTSNLNLNIEQSKKEEGEVTQEDAPNVYYFLFDEYSSFSVIKKYFEYDNSEFEVFLQDNKFTISYNSYNNSYRTTTVTTNVLNLEYVVDDNTTEKRKEQLRTESNLEMIMREAGYNIVGVGEASSFLGIGEGAEEGTSYTIEGQTTEQVIMQNTFLYPLFQQTINADAQIISDAFSYFDEYKKPSEKQFLMFYIECPHQPFIFNSSGKINNGSNWHNWKDKQYYLGQYIYITEKIETMIEQILEVDPEAVILLQSDHSARYLENEDGEYVISDEDRRNFFNAVYYQGKAVEEIVGKSGVNTLRIVMNKVLGLNLEELNDA